MQSNRNLPLGGDEYGATHDIDENGGALVNNHSADAATKIAGEGARWQCIGNNAASLADGTRIFTNQNAGDRVSDQVRYVPFYVLWKSWAASFEKVYGISDATVAKKLAAETLSLTTLVGSPNYAILSAQSTAMNLAQDICVDPVKPQSPADLAVKRLKFLYFNKAASVDASANTLDQEIDAVKTAVGNGRGIRFRGLGGYAGKRKFGFVCEVDANANLQGIGGYGVAEGSAQDLLAYPTYRDGEVDAQIFKHANAVALAKGESILAREREAAYDKSVADIVEDIQLYVEEIPDTVDLDALVRATVIPWQGGAEPLPDNRFDVGGDDPQAYYQQLVGDKVNQLAATNLAKFNAAVEAALQQLSGWDNKPSSKQASLRRTERKKLAPRFGLNPDDY